MHLNVLTAFNNYCFSNMCSYCADFLQSFFDFKCPELVVICVQQLFITKYDTPCQNTRCVMNTVINSFILNVAVPTEHPLLV